MSNLDHVTAIIKTFERPRALQRLIRSIRRYYPRLKIVVGDDSFRPYPRKDVRYLRLSPDVGASAGRNALLQQVETPYFLQLDDDFEFNEATRIESLQEVVESGQADLAGGDCLRCKRKFCGLLTRRKPSPYHGFIKLKNGQLTMHRSESDGQSVHLCDIVAQFFVARIEDVLSIGGWDAELKTEEHEEFFLRFGQHGFQSAFCPNVKVWHWNDRPKFYRKFRGRNYRPLAAARMGVKRWTNFDGQTWEFA